MHTADLIQQARLGEPGSLGQLLQLYRNYLRLLADSQLDRKLRARIEPSDVVQETFLAAHRDFGKFLGKSEREFLAWLRQILIHNIFHTVEKHVLAEKRDVRREVSLEQIGRGVDRSGVSLGAILAASGVSPSTAAIRGESAVKLADCMSRLSPNYREVLLLRNFKGLPFEQVATEMGRSAGSTRVMWLRAIRRLREFYDQDEE